MRIGSLSPAWGAVLVFVVLGITFIYQSTTSIGCIGHLIISGVFFAMALFISIMLIKDIKEDKDNAWRKETLVQN